MRRATGDGPVPQTPHRIPARQQWREGADAAGGLAGAAPSACVPAVIRAITCPTLTVSPSWARISAIVPEAGAGNSMSTLSVEISTTVSPSDTWSPTFTVHSRIVPSVTDSPISGISICTVAVCAISGLSV